MSRVSAGRALILGTLAVVLPALLAAAPTKPAPTGKLQGQLSVREVEVNVELPDDLSPFKLMALGAKDFIALRDGREQSVARAERSAAQDRSWTSLVWVDRTLASPPAVSHMLAALAERSADLTRLGSVEIVIADPAPRLVLPASDDPRLVRAALGEAAAQPAGEATAVWQTPGASALRQQADRLEVWLAARRAVGPRALWLPMDGAPMPLAAVVALGGRALPSSTLPTDDGERVAVLSDLERVLAAYGWTTLTMVDAGRSSGVSPRADSEYDRYQRDAMAQHSSHSSGGAVLFRFPFRRTDRSRFDPRTLDALLDPKYAAARLVAEETGGWMIAGAWDLPNAFDALGRRWRVWLTAPEPAEGGVEALVLKLKKGPDLRATRWLRSAVPPAIAQARLRELLRGQAAGGDLELAVRRDSGGATAAGADPGGMIVTATVADFDEAHSALWRWSGAARLADGSVVFPAIHAEQGATGWRLRIAAPAGISELVLSVEDLKSERFGAARLELSPVAR